MDGNALPAVALGLAERLVRRAPVAPAAAIDETGGIADLVGMRRTSFARSAARTRRGAGARGLLLALALALAVTFAPAAKAETITFTQARPSAETPNAPGSLVLPVSLSTPPAVPEQRSYAQLLALWQAAGRAYGVPWQVLGAINKVESDFGRNMGPSSAGALGWMQFMPSTWLRWGMDANGDGVANPWNPEDAVYAAARYLAAAGGREDIEGAIFAYNHADWYVQEVLELAQLFAAGGVSSDSSLVFSHGSAGSDAVFRIDEMEQKLAAARRTVARRQRLVVAAEGEVERAGWRTLAAEQHAGDPKLGNREFRRLEAKVTRLVLAERRAERKLERRRAELAAAVERLQALRGQARAAEETVSFSSSLSSSFGTPEASGEYVFPVGGGPETVSVAHTHHDYPAADIAAPEGAPLYALTDAIVVAAWPSPSGRCGIGLELQAGDGQKWLYCHLSYLEEDVVPNRVVSAGTPVGLVGSTGSATGPHLHLQLVPTSSYPQEQAWFGRFAGAAFRWQDAATPSSSGRVFRIVSD
ncbi:MAG: lytic murein transglycosylase [Actinomycetota bacterium]|nr:lytic murein transglycosylase [Actinomycetota bacterium]